MRLPRDISSKELIKLLKKFDYEITRQKRSHIRLTTSLTASIISLFLIMTQLD